MGLGGEALRPTACRNPYNAIGPRHGERFCPLNRTHNTWDHCAGKVVIAERKRRGGKAAVRLHHGSAESPA